MFDYLINYKITIKTQIYSTNYALRRYVTTRNNHHQAIFKTIFKVYKVTVHIWDPKGHQPATLYVHYTTSCNTESSAPEDGQNNCPKHVELTGIFNKPLLLHLVGFYIIYISLYFFETC